MKWYKTSRAACVVTVWFSNESWVCTENFATSSSSVHDCPHQHQARESKRYNHARAQRKHSLLGHTYTRHTNTHHTYYILCMCQCFKLGATSYHVRPVIVINITRSFIIMNTHISVWIVLARSLATDIANERRKKNYNNNFYWKSSAQILCAFFARLLFLPDEIWIFWFFFIIHRITIVVNYEDVKLSHL